MGVGYIYIHAHAVFFARLYNIIQANQIFRKKRYLINKIDNKKNDYD